MVDTEWFREAARQPESALLDHKQAFPPLETKAGKATFVRDVLAMANATTPVVSGYLLYGVRDLKQGGGIVGTETIPTEETIQQMLGSYTAPVPEVVLTPLDLDGFHVAALEIRWNESHPFLCSRDVPDVLSRTQAYSRHGSTNAILTVPELMDMIRKKDARVGAPVAQPLVAGFIQEPKRKTSEQLVYRLHNTSAEPIAEINSTLDMRSRGPGRHLYRQRDLTNTRLQPGEIRDVETDIHHLPLGRHGCCLRDSQLLEAYWLDIELLVKYRSEDGLVEHLVVSTAIDGY